MKVLCPARVSLFFERAVRPGRPPSALFVKLSLCDELELTVLRRDEVELELAGEEPAPEGAGNSVATAAEAFRRAFGVRLGVRLRLTKRIPVGSGLHGAHSDAGGCLRGMAKLFSPFPGRVGVPLMRLAKKLGPDVPFFVQPHNFAVERNGRLTAVSVSKPLPFMVVAFTGVRLPAGQALAALRGEPAPVGLTRLSHLDKLVCCLEEGRSFASWEEHLFNWLEKTRLAADSKAAQARGILERLGLRGVRMSGTGPSVFGFSGTFEGAERALKALREYPWRSFLTCSNG